MAASQDLCIFPTRKFALDLGVGHNNNVSEPKGIYVQVCNYAFVVSCLLLKADSWDSAGAIFGVWKAIFEEPLLVLDGVHATSELWGESQHHSISSSLNSRNLTCFSHLFCSPSTREAKWCPLLLHCWSSCCDSESREVPFVMKHGFSCGCAITSFCESIHLANVPFSLTFSVTSDLLLLHLFSVGGEGREVGGGQLFQPESGLSPSICSRDTTCQN